jgi:hypothetical protein
MEGRIYDILTDLLRDDITKDKAIEELLVLCDVSQQRELLKKWWKYFDEKSVAINCNDKEREEVINDFFNCA